MTALLKSTALTFTLSFATLYAGSTHEHSHDDKAHEHSKKESTQAGHAHSHHFDKIKKGMSKTEIETVAKKEVQHLVAEKKIPNSWKDMPISKIGKTHYGDSDDWVVGFDNMQIKNKKRQTLYIFISIYGDIRGANYTGN